MNKAQLQSIIDSDLQLKTHILGVFAEDTIPLHIPVGPVGFIANIEQESKPGSHWVSFYVDSKRRGFFFDSFGRPPHHFSSRFYNFFVANEIPFIWNSVNLQDSRTNVCGQYCIFCLSLLCRDWDLYSIINIFSTDRLCNDMYVYDFISSVY